MKSFVIRLLYFAVPVPVVYILLTLFALPHLIEKTEGPNTISQIKASFQNAKNRNYDLLIAGNSKTYRGIDPAVIDTPTYNFSHDNDSYNQIYYKLKYLEKIKKKIKYLVLSTDYFQFSFITDTRNYAYSAFLDKAYLKDYPHSSAYKQFLYKTHIFDFDRMSYLANIFTKQEKDVYQKSNGQYIKPGKALPGDSRPLTIQRLPVQVKYFNLILDYCAKNNIEVFICMLPDRPNVLKCYTASQIQDFNKFINSYTNNRVHYLDYSHQPGWRLQDYTDIVHLNEKAADKFSKELNDTINTYINKPQANLKPMP